MRDRCLPIFRVEMFGESQRALGVGIYPVLEDYSSPAVDISIGDREILPSLILTVWHARHFFTVYRHMGIYALMDRRCRIGTLIHRRDIYGTFPDIIHHG